jgi:hypothetical protein
MGWLATGAASSFQYAIRSVMSGAFACCRSTTWLVPSTEARTMSSLPRSYRMSSSVKRRPLEAAEVTRRSWPDGSGMVQTYGWWVWPVTSASTPASVRSAMSTIGPESPEPGPAASQSLLYASDSG